MLHLLLDEHVPPAVAVGAKRHCRGIKIVPLRDWNNGEFLGAPDELILSASVAEGLTLVTYDQKTVRPLFKRFIEEGQENRGVIFVDERSIPPECNRIVVPGFVRTLEER
jgi:hypothetical protein